MTEPTPGTLPVLDLRDLSPEELKAALRAVMLAEHAGRICYGRPRVVEDKRTQSLRVEVDTAIPVEPFSIALFRPLGGKP